MRDGPAAINLRPMLNARFAFDADDDTRMDVPDLAALMARFDSAMAGLGPFEPRPRLVVAVSGGADSMALALLARTWAAERGGTVLALTVDHGLRPEAAAEADLTLARLADRGLPGRKLTIRHLRRGPALAERAREARYRLLVGACAAAGVVHLLLGHHRGDQVETVMMRALSASTERGLAGMPALRETGSVRLLRPLLDVSPGELRAWLTARGVGWIEDPSNRDPGALRARLRLARDDPSGTSEGTLAVSAAARQAGARRAARDGAIALALAERATIRPEGYAVLTPGPIDPDALAALLRAIAGSEFPPPLGRVASLARALAADTIGGVRVAPAGRLGPGWLLVREARAMASAVVAAPGVVWDGRFRLTGHPPGTIPRGLVLGALAEDAARFRDRRGPPALVLRTLPALRRDAELIAVPHLGFGDPCWRMTFSPRNAAAAAPFKPA